MNASASELNGGAISLSSPGLYLILNPDSKVVAVSKDFLSAFKQKRESIVGKDLPALLKKVIKNGKNISQALTISLLNVIERKKPGNPVVQTAAGRDSSKPGPLYLHIDTPMLDEHDEVVYVLHVINKVTDVQGDILEMTNQPEYLKNLVENSENAILSVGMDRHIISWNTGAEKMFGYNRKEVLGRTAESLGLLKLTQPEIDTIMEQLKKDGNWKSEMNFYRKNGERFFGVISANIVEQEMNGSRSIVIVVTDVTEGKRREDKLQVTKKELEEMVQQRTEELAKRERRFRALLENSVEIINLLDESLKIIYRSPSAARVGGYSDEEIIGTDTRNKIHPDDIDEVTRQIKSLMSSPGAAVTARFRYRHKDGHYMWLEGTATNLLKDENVQAIVFNYQEITDKVNSRLAFAEQERKMEAIFSMVPELVYSFTMRPDGNLRFTYASRAMEDILGVPFESVRENLDILTESYYQADKELVVASIIQSARELSPWKLEFRYRHPLKGLVWLQSHSIPKREPDGSITWHGIISDITLRKKAEKAIRESEEKYRAITDQAFDGIICYNEKGIILDCNERASFNTGYPPHELKGMNIMQLFPADELLYRPLDLEIIKGGNPVLDIRKIRKKDGSVTTIEVSTRQIAENRFLAVGRDITEQSKARNQEALFASIVSSSDDAIISLTTSGIINSWNRGATYIYGYTEEEMLGRDISILIPEGAPNDEIDIMKRIIRGDIVRHFETRRRRKDGNIIDVSITCSPVRNRQGFVTGSAKISRDITKQKRQREEIRISNDRYKAVAKATSDAIWDYDFTTDRTFISGTGYKYLFGYNIVDTYSEKNFWETRIHPDDKERVMNELAVTLADTNRYQAASEYRFLKADGKYTYLSDRYFIIRKKGKPVRMLGAKQDITSIKNAEEELRKNLMAKKMLAHRLSAILNTLPATIALLNEEGIIIDMNEAWKNKSATNRFMGYKTVVGDDYLAIARAAASIKSDDQNAEAGIKQVLSGGLSDFEYEYTAGSGTEQKWYRMVVSAMQKEEYTGAVVMHIDISELRRLERDKIRSKTEEQKKITRAMIQGQEKERNFIARELHDNVNQILAGTKVLLSVVSERTERAAELVPLSLENISLAIEENRKISHELITPDLKEERLDEQILRLCRKMLHPAGFQTNISQENFIESKLNDDQKIAVYRIIQEQCTNIIKYSGGRNVGISISTSESELFMTIADDGLGMPSTKKSGGIGLRNMESRLQVFGGTVEIETASGKGFKLFIKMPLHSQENGAGSEPE